MTKETQKIIGKYLGNGCYRKNIAKKAMISESELREAVGFSTRKGLEFSWLSLHCFLLDTDTKYSDNFIAEVNKMKNDEIDELLK